MSCEFEFSCKNNNKCFRCVDQSLLNIEKKPWEKANQFKRKSGFTKKETTKASQQKDSWKDLEQQVADSLNNVPSIVDARRSRASGALWFETGDIVDEILHPECKERTGRQLKSGDQSISIQKRWLEKASEECRQSDKVMCLPFRFKGDTKIYTIFDHDDIAQLITTMKSYMRDNERKTIEIEQLKLKLEEVNK